MKKTKVLILFISFFLFMGTIRAGNEMNRIDIFIQLDSEGNASITEIWDTTLDSGTELYKPMTNLGNSNISDFQVREGSHIFQYIDSWDIQANFIEKKYKNGLHKTDEGYELCWGISEYGSHQYQISYKISNFVSNVSDKQMIYWRLVNQEMEPSPNKVRIEISGMTPFSDNLPVWGYGYKGYAYVKDGKIHMETENGLSSSQYMVLLAEFEPNTFNTTNQLEGTFNDWLEKAENDTYQYNYHSTIDIIGEILPVIIMGLVWLGVIIGIYRSFKSSDKVPGNYDFLEYKTNSSSIKEAPYFRDIPCNKDIYRAYFIASLYCLTKRKTDFLGSNLLKWVNEGLVEVQLTTTKVLKNQESKIAFLKEISSFPEENELYNMMRKASKDDILEKKEFGKWCSNNYHSLIDWFDTALKKQRDLLVEEGKLKKITKKSMGVFSHDVYQVTPSLYQEAIQLAGLKKFLEDFSDMKHKEAIEVHLWKEYLMLAQIFGIASKVAKQFKNLYPDVITDVEYDSVIFLYDVSYYGTGCAESARQAAQAYNSGGGGFSSGGGGGGSFGGGSGGGVR